MNPQLDWRYPLVMLAALVAAGLLLRRTQRALPIDAWQKYGLGLGAFCGGFLGAKVPFLLGDIEGVCNGSAFWTGGKTIMAGIVGAYLGVEIAKWGLEVAVRTGDSFAVPCAVGVAIGRIACFVGGCCFGQPTAVPWGVVFPTAGDSLPRHPTQLYEAAFHAACAVALAILQSQRRFQGQTIKLYILAYLGYRFATEFLRPESRVLWNLTAYQWAALALAPVFVWLWRRDAAAIAEQMKK